MLILYVYMFPDVRSIAIILVVYMYAYCMSVVWSILLCILFFCAFMGLFCLSAELKCFDLL